MKEFDFIYNSLRKCTQNIDVIFIPFSLTILGMQLQEKNSITLKKYMQKN